MAVLNAPELTPITASGAKNEAILIPPAEPASDAKQAAKPAPEAQQIAKAAISVSQ